MRVDVDLRRRTLERNAFSCRRISGCCAASTDETHIPGGAPTLVTFGRLMPVNCLCSCVPLAEPSSRPSAILCGLRRVAYGPNGFRERTADARALPGGYNRLAGPPEWHVSTERAWVGRYAC